MWFRPTASGDAFREEVRDFLRRELPAEGRAVREDGWVIGFSPTFSRKLGQRGWLGLTWPRSLRMAGVLGPGSPRAALGGRVARAMLYAPAYTIQGGTSNTLRNIIAHRGLGLPAD